MRVAHGVILMLANGESYSRIEAIAPCYRDYINRRQQRFLEAGLDGLRPRYRGQPPTALTPAMEARVLEKTRQAPPDGSTHRSTRKLGRVLRIHHNFVRKAWERAGLQPHRFERYIASDDPDFEQKAADVIGLYVNPPDHAAVFAVDEKTTIQALDRLDPVLPLSLGRAERHGFEYYRHGTLSLFAALDTASGEVFAQTVPRHTSAAFVDVLGDIVASQPKRREIHVIADTHASKTDPDAKLYRRAANREARLSYLGHLVIENRHGLIVDAMASTADGRAECEVATVLLHDRVKQRGWRRRTLGADKAYDTREFVETLRALAFTPHVTQNLARRGGSRIDRRTTRHDGYAKSQHARPRIEPAFGWLKPSPGSARSNYGDSQTSTGSSALPPPHSICGGWSP
jgi:transposase